MGNYVENTVAWMEHKGLADKYRHAGIYCIKIDADIVYIGKSANMLRRIAEHYVGIKTASHYVGIKSGSEKKYRLLSEIQRNGHKIEFDVLYYAKRKGIINQLAEIGEKEGEYIRCHKPILNTQIPKAEDWKKYDNNEVNAREVLQQRI